MNYKISYENKDEDLITRLLKIRNISDDIDVFLNPKLSDYWLDPFLLNDMEKAVDRLVFAMKKQEKIMIFGDYDVDGVTSSYILYKFITKYLWYNNVSIQYPDRIKDWYWLKNIHLDIIKEKWISLVITVDNGITSIQEALYAKTLWIDLIITDHHHALDEIPQAFAVINPQVSPNYPFKWLAWVGVAFKFICALLSKSTFNQEKRNKIFNYFLPMVAIWTVADIVPLVNENRVIVKKWLEMINNHRDHIPSALKWLLTYLNIQQPIDTFHIGFVIWPRINAGGRIKSPYDSLYSLLYSGAKQLPFLDNLEAINTERRLMTERMFKEAESQIDMTQKMIVAYSQNFHEGIVGIVSGRLTEKYYKPSIVLKVDEEKGIAVASLRWPDYFNIIEMIKSAEYLLKRFGWHRWAGWLSVELKNLELLIAHFSKYCNEKITDNNLKKSVCIDTKIYHQEWDDGLLDRINKLAPFGEGNKEPVFLAEQIEVSKIEKVWNSKRWHLKIHGNHGDKKITTLFWGKWDESVAMILEKKSHVDIVWKVKKDSFNGWWFFEWIEIL